MASYEMYEPQKQSQSYGTSYSENTSSYAPMMPMQPQKKGRCPTGGKCTVCTRLCMMD